MGLFEEILKARGLTGRDRDAFLNPSYDDKHDPFLLPDMERAVDRLIEAKEKKQPITIYGDYDIDGLTATALLLDAFEQFGFDTVSTFIPNRFVEGYGLTEEAIERIAKDGTRLIITVDCGSLSEKEIIRANELGVDVIVTDHHNVAATSPPAVAVINPKRLLAMYPEEYDNFVIKKSSKMKNKVYPFLDLAGVGVAFKLVQAMQSKISGLDPGQEKWLLDLVALGTVCDVVSITNENRANVYWGIKVLARTKRPGLKALMAVARITPDKLTARSLGFGLGPRMNASGRLQTAQHSLDLLITQDPSKALDLAQKLDVMNTTRKNEQSQIVDEAKVQAVQLSNDPVLVLSGKNWNHGIVGIVAAKIMEMYKKPTFVLEEMGQESKGSARSYGDFSVADAVDYAREFITKGGGHKYAAGVTMPTKNIEDFRRAVNEFYRTRNLFNQQKLLMPQEDAHAKLSDVDEHLIEQLLLLEPYGNANPEPVLLTRNVIVKNVRRMGNDAQHIKLTVQDIDGRTIHMVAFSAPAYFFVDVGATVDVLFQPYINEWNGQKSVEGRLLHLTKENPLL